jgi:A/G-specific adenine glycosylase
VVPKYQAFIRQYPTVTKLAKASLGDVLRLWQGLGYNRRAKFLLQCAQKVSGEYSGVFPTTYIELLPLPGIGPYTAAAICAFAYNQPVELVETNVRQVYIHHFFKQAEQVTDMQILEKVRRTLPTDQSRQWYAALMDYGTHLKALHGNNTRKVKGYSKQSKFTGSNREVRAAIVRALTVQPLTKKELWQELQTYEQTKIQPQIDDLLAEHMILLVRKKYQLP